MLAALICLALWLTLTTVPKSWTVKISVTEVDDALSVQTRPCSVAFPLVRLIALSPARVPLQRDSTVGPDSAIVLPHVTAKTVITLQLYNDGGVGDLRGSAADRESARRIFTFSSPHVPDGEYERVWASSWFGDGRPAPLADGCERGLETDVVRAAAPSARPPVSPFRPDEERRGWLLTLSLALFALAILLLLVAMAQRIADGAEQLARIRNIVAAGAALLAGTSGLMALFGAPLVLKAAPAALGLIGTAGAAMLSVLEWRAPKTGS